MAEILQAISEFGRKALELGYAVGGGGKPEHYVLNVRRIEKEVQVVLAPDIEKVETCEDCGNSLDDDGYCEFCGDCGTALLDATGA